MRLAEKPMPRSYHALNYDWTPLSRNSCWLSNVVHLVCCYVKRNRLVLISTVGDYRQRLHPTNHKVCCVGGKSFADDLVASGYCKCESSPCTTIHWGFSRVSLICSSLPKLKSRRPSGRRFDYYFIVTSKTFPRLYCVACCGLRKWFASSWLRCDLPPADCA